MGVVAPPRKLFPNWTKVSLRTTHDWRIKFKRANEKQTANFFPVLEHFKILFRIVSVLTTLAAIILHVCCTKKLSVQMELAAVTAR